jgi:hypothetical protein
MDLMSLLQGHLTEDVVNQLSQQTGAAPQQTATAAQGIFSTLISGLAKNASTEGGANGILSALDRDHDGSILDDVMGLVAGAMQNGGGGTSNGAGILNHILGGQQQNAAQMLSQTSGVSQNGIMDMMIKLAPMVMGVIGQQHQQGGLNASALSGLLGNAVQTQSSNPLMQMATQFLDKNGDGSAMDEIMGMVGSKLLGGLFGGK